MARKAINKVDILKDKKIEVSVLVIVGDQVKLMVEASEKIAKGCKSSRLVILKKSMDPSNLVSPEKFDKEVFRYSHKKVTFRCRIEFSNNLRFLYGIKQAS